MSPKYEDETRDDRWRRLIAIVHNYYESDRKASDTSTYLFSQIVFDPVNASAHLALAVEIIARLADMASKGEGAALMAALLEDGALPPDPEAPEPT